MTENELMVAKNKILRKIAEQRDDVESGEQLFNDYLHW